MIVMTTQTIEQLAAEYEDFSMDAKHRVLGEALYHLQVVTDTHSIPGIEGVEVIPNMKVWCYPPPWSTRIPQSVQACLAGIWSMARVQALLNMCTLPPAVDSVMDYLDMVATTTSLRTLYELVGLEVLAEYDDSIPVEDVQLRLHSLMEDLPLMKEAYDIAKGAAPHGGLT